MLTVEEDSKSYQVLVDENTKLRRRFFGQANWDEFKVDHEVNVFGKWEDENKTKIKALLIRDLSIQKRFGVFIGEVTAINGNELTVSTVHRDIQKVELTNSTKLVDRKMQIIKQTDILVGHRIRIKGMWDRSVNTVAEVEQLKDFSLPPKAVEVISVTPTQKPTPTAIPTPNQ